jgi:regulator of protease activity HflC (stomatin/prohibitin superfamily)
MRPYEPVVLETIAPQEEGFLIPLTGDTDKQTSKRSHDPAKDATTGENDFTPIDVKQVQIPHRWVQTGYNYWVRSHDSGKWEPSVTLIKVDRSPVTREWTADENSGTSNKNEAIWVMTSDQVEFSTGWTCTARIATKQDAAKFLHNYRNETLSQVLDHEVRAKIQTVFGGEVTDLPMEKLRKDATPHIQKVVKETTAFFAERGITITNIGISGGFVYKDKSIQAKLVEVFNAEQEKTIAKAKSETQEELNKSIQLKAEAESQATLTKSKAEAQGIQAVADAKAYEIAKAQENKEIYLELKRLELETKKQEKWDGKFPTYFMGGQGLNTLLSVPMPPPAK